MQPDGNELIQVPEISFTFIPDTLLLLMLHTEIVMLWPVVVIHMMVNGTTVSIVATVVFITFVRNKLLGILIIQRRIEVTECEEHVVKGGIC